MGPQLDNVGEYNSRLLINKDCPEFDIAELPVGNVDDLFCFVMKLDVVFLSIWVAESARAYFLNEALFLPR